jgi:alkanesulfonate monooxygenase SsuD/methylene tetrahydromethanopterin reductase-like flavin-dependent oxidoreductase (luciferase family)
VRYCDGWIPVGIRPRDLPAATKDLHERAARVGRKPSELPVSIFGAPSKEDTLKQFQDAGVDRVVIGLPSDSKAKVLSLLDRCAPMVQKFM